MDKLLGKIWTFGFMVMGYFYNTQKAEGGSVGAHSYRTAGRGKVTCTMGFHGTNKLPTVCVLRAGFGQAHFTLWGIFFHVGLLQWELHVSGKVVIYQRKQITQ